MNVHRIMGAERNGAMKVAALGILLLGAGPMLARAWNLNFTQPDGESAIRWLMGASVCIALAAALLK